MVVKALGVRHSPCQGRVVWNFSANQSTCFAAGTPIKLPDGNSKPIEEFQIGDAILTRHEWDVDGELRAGTVSAVWKTEAFIYNLHVGDGYIETTRDHPFYVKDFGWKTAYELRAGDELRTSHGWVVCRGVADSGRTETVYNVTVAEDHTYFVGGETWGFAVWAHNGQYYHYTNKAGFNGINASRRINASSRYTRHGVGPAVFLTTLNPDQLSKKAIKKLGLTNKKITHVIEFSLPDNAVKSLGDPRGRGKFIKYIPGDIQLPEKGVLGRLTGF